MTIVSFKIIESSIQGGGEQRIQVAFMDHLEREHRRSYDLPKDVDISKAIEARKSNVEQGLKDQDIELATRRIELGKSFKLEYASDTELKLKLEERKLEKQEEIDKLTSEKDKISEELKKEK